MFDVVSTFQRRFWHQGGVRAPRVPLFPISLRWGEGFR